MRVTRVMAAKPQPVTVDKFLRALQMFDLGVSLVSEIPPDSMSHIVDSLNTLNRTLSF